MCVCVCVSVCDEGVGSLSLATSEWDQRPTNSRAVEKVCSHVKGVFVTLVVSLLLVGQVG